MPERPPDPLDALRAPIIPIAPDPSFASRLRERLTRLQPASINEERTMSIDLTNRPRNGVRHGDVSYITLGLPDLARGRAFYGTVLNWRFGPDDSEHGAEVDDIAPMIGLRDGDQPQGGRIHGAVLGFRVDDIAAAVDAVRANGGTISDPHPEPYGITAEGHDNQGVALSLHQLPPAARRSTTTEFHNGDVEGDVSYLTMVVADIDAAHAFYHAVFGWTFNVGRAGGAQVTGVAPQIGMTTRPESGPATPGVILCYRVDDIVAATDRVRRAGGQARPAEQQPYGLESLCADDQGTPFYLHQF